MRNTYFATIGQKTPTSKNSRVQVQIGPFDWFGQVCGKEVIRDRRIWSGRLRKAQKAVFRCRMFPSIHGRPTCHFAENFLDLFFSYSFEPFESQAAFGFFFFLFLFNDFRNPGNILPHIGNESLRFLPGYHALIMNNSLVTLSRTW